MALSTLHRRASALEDAFFHQVDQQLIARLDAQRQLEVDEDALAIATGIGDRNLLDELLEADITPKTLVALSLYPAIFVAWSDGHIEPRERRAVLKAAESLGIQKQAPAWDLVDAWLNRRPAPHMFDVWADFIRAIVATMPQAAFQQLRDAAMDRAEEIALVAGGFLGLMSISQAERTALTRLGNVFRHASENVTDSTLS